MAKQIDETRLFPGNFQPKSHLARGDGTFGQSIILPDAPVEVLYVKIIAEDGKESVLDEASAAGDKFFARTGADGRTIALGAQIAVPFKDINDRPNIIVRYVPYVGGWSPDLGAVPTSEQYALQGDAEARYIKNIGSWVETDTTVNFVTAISKIGATTTAARIATANITGMPWNKFWIHQLTFYNTSQEDMRLWFANSSTFNNLGLNLDKLGGWIDIASVVGVQLGSSTPYRWQFPDNNADLVHPVSFVNAFHSYMYVDEDATQTIHLLLENKSDSDHVAGASKIKIKLWIEPIG